MAMMSCRLSIGWFVIVLIKDTSLVSLWLKRPWATTCVTPPKKHTHTKKTPLHCRGPKQRAQHPYVKLWHHSQAEVLHLSVCQDSYLRQVKRTQSDEKKLWTDQFSLRKKKKQDRKNNKRSFLQAQKDWTANSKSLLPRLRPPLWPLR